MARAFGRIGILVLVLGGLAPPPAWACSCVGGMPACEQFWFGAGEFPRALFEGTVVSIVDDLGPEIEGRRYRIKRVRLATVRALTGTPSEEVTTGAGGGDCGYRFEIGRRYVIDATRNPSTGEAGTGLCSMTKPFEEAAEVLAFVASLSQPSAGGRAFGTVERSSGSSSFGQPERSPMAGVRVLLHGPRSSSTTTDAAGAFAFAELPPGRYQMSVEMEGRPELRVPPPEEFTIANPHACHRSWVRLPVNGVIEGTVIEGTGAPAQGVWLSLREADAPHVPPRFQLAHSDELGRFAFTELPPGRYAVGVNLQLGPQRTSPYAVAYATDTSGAAEIVELGLGALHQLRPLTVTRLELTKVAGQVVWPDGSPAAECRVIAQPLVEGRIGMAFGAPDTGADGRFELDVFKGIPYRFRAANCTRNGAELDRIGGDGFVQLVLRDRR